jgi:hypothetical protein
MVRKEEEKQERRKEIRLSHEANNSNIFEVKLLLNT